jgi:hypothetical protein
MSVDLGDLLRDASGAPSTTPDPDEVWRRGRHRRRLRTLAASAGGLAVIAALVILPLAAGGGLQPVIEPLGQDEGAPSDEGVADTTDSADEVAEAEPAEGHDPTDLQRLQEDEVSRMEQLVREVEQQRLRAEREAAIEAEARAEAEAETEAEAEPEASTPEPDASRVNDPCAAHEGGEMRAFIDVVAPVEGQHVGGTLDLVGCASVFEGTIQYRILDAGGTVVLEDFTTATAGGPEIGEFRVNINLPATGDLVVEVYWEDQATGSEAHPDGPERDLVRVPFRAG